jgi:hypothetical protein
MKHDVRIKPEDCAEVRIAIGLFVRQLLGTNLHYHNAMGNNKDGLMHVFGMAPIAYGAMMLTAGVFKLRKARGGANDEKCLSFNRDVWESIIASVPVEENFRPHAPGLFVC